MMRKRTVIIGKIKMSLGNDSAILFPFLPLLKNETMTHWSPIYISRQTAWLRLCSTPKDARSVFAASLHDKSDSWVGIIRLNPKEELSEPEIRKEVYEFISISLGKVPIVSDLNVTLPALPPDSVFRKEFGGRVLEEWDLIIERHRSSAFYEFYNVLWIERCNGVAYRKGLGRVMKDAWERQDLEEIKITLG
jgi:hypothetical protein